MAECILYQSQVPVVRECDVLVVGAGPAGVPAAVSAAREGAKVILCSHMGKPHNIFTEGFGLTKKEKKAVEKLPEAEREAAKAEYLKKQAAKIA